MRARGKFLAITRGDLEVGSTAKIFFPNSHEWACSQAIQPQVLTPEFETFGQGPNILYSGSEEGTSLVAGMHEFSVNSKDLYRLVHFRWLPAHGGSQQCWQQSTFMHFQAKRSCIKEQNSCRRVFPGYSRERALAGISPMLFHVTFGGKGKGGRYGLLIPITPSHRQCKYDRSPLRLWRSLDRTRVIVVVPL